MNYPSMSFHLRCQRCDFIIAVKLNVIKTIFVLKRKKITPPVAQRMYKNIKSSRSFFFTETDANYPIITIYVLCMPCSPLWSVMIIVRWHGLALLGSSLIVLAADTAKKRWEVRIEECNALVLVIGIQAWLE